MLHTSTFKPKNGNREVLSLLNRPRGEDIPEGADRTYFPFSQVLRIADALDSNDNSVPGFPAGYHVGYTRKGWAPGNLGARPRNPAGPQFDSFSAFLEQRPEGTPFSFWFGTHDPHRVYDTGSGAASGIRG